jgi:hypothetical protein
MYSRTAKRYAKYGLTEADIERMYAEQDGKCGLCLEDLSLFTFVIDHNHTTGKVRSLLHDACNKRLGFYEKGYRISDKTLIPVMQKYLDKYGDGISVEHYQEKLHLRDLIDEIQYALNTYDYSKTHEEVDKLLLKYIDAAKVYDLYDRAVHYKRAYGNDGL